jgi:thiamine-monophosphate kinase
VANSCHFRFSHANAYDISELPLSERDLIERFAGFARSAGAGRRPRKLSPQIGSPQLVRGIGDDCAVLRSPGGDDLLVTTDFSLEGVHFRREWHPPESVGQRCLARGLSDIAAMGGKPVTAFLSLAVPPACSQFWVDRFMRGFLRLAGAFGVRLAGGDTAQSPAGVLADIIVLGSVPRGKAVLRSGAHPRDRIYVTGALGGSAAALQLLREARPKKLDPRKFPRHFFPEPRIGIGEFLRKEKLPSAMIDTSDGLSTDLSHICEQSSVGAKLWAERVPRARIPAPRKVVDLQLGLHGGEDYELLFTVPADLHVPRSIAGVPITCIGAITRNRKILLVNKNGSCETLKPAGWEHFRSNSDE